MKNLFPLRPDMPPEIINTPQESCGQTNNRELDLKHVFARLRCRFPLRVDLVYTTSQLLKLGVDQELGYLFSIILKLVHPLTRRLGSRFVWSRGKRYHIMAKLDPV
jgi:hypothetical protein